MVACFCIGGENCCVTKPQAPSPFPGPDWRYERPYIANGPYKCPDCGTWWSGLEHRCPDYITTTGTSPVISWPQTWPGTGIGDVNSWCTKCSGYHAPGMHSGTWNIVP
jgi:hypothetical protein